MSGEIPKSAEHEGAQTFTLGFLALGLIIGMIMGIAASGSVLFGQSFVSPSCAGPTDVISPEAAGARTIEFLAGYAVSPDITVALADVTELETANLYQVTVNFSMEGASEEQVVYLTKDGTVLLPGAIDIDEFEELVAAQGLY
ncbi:MAG TPA: hypothetical protein ENN68_01575 [Methanomicrobia archaeon]|nr:hypothetical protein [Methanomicrobia archaeon]